MPGKSNPGFLGIDNPCDGLSIKLQAVQTTVCQIVDKFVPEKGY
jgi:hypothetical protein